MNNLKQLKSYARKKFWSLVGQEVEDYDNFINNIITLTYETAIKDCLEKMGTHAEGEYLGYCDTGADMENACRSECTEMAMKRLKDLLPNNK